MVDATVHVIDRGSLECDLNYMMEGHTLGTHDEPNPEVDDLARRTIESQERLLRVNPRPVTQEDVAELFRDALHNWKE